MILLLATFKAQLPVYVSLCDSARYASLRRRVSSARLRSVMSLLVSRIAMGIDADLNEAFRIATRNTIDFLVRRAGLSALDAYSLASIAVSFRVTQFVNKTRGVHAMVPKALFSAERRVGMAIV